MFAQMTRDDSTLLREGLRGVIAHVDYLVQTS